MNNTLAVLLAASLAVSASAGDFAPDWGAARDLVLRARAARAWTQSHKNGILQRVNEALVHLNAEAKPAVAMIRAGSGSGTGFIVRRDGTMITNAHVVLETGVGGRVTVAFADGSEHEGVVVAVGSMGTEQDPLSGRDLAIVTLPRRAKAWPVLPLGDASRVREGEMVAVLGYPMGLPYTMTQGVVSGLDRREGGVTGFPVKFVQTDAAINGGNSGGPLVTMAGEVIGVNTLSFSRGGGSDGLGFAVGVGAVKAFLTEYDRRGSFADASAAASGATGCPSPDALAAAWVEHAGPLPAERYREHLAAALDAAEPTLVPVGTVASWIGASRRGRGEDRGEPACRVLGSAALYLIGPEDDPQVDFVKEVQAGDEAGLWPRLVELRWFDAAAGRKNRWRKGAGSGLPLPDAVNEVL